MTIEMIVIGQYYYKFDAFAKAPAWIWFLILFMTSETYIIIAMFFTTVVSTKT